MDDEPLTERDEEAIRLFRDGMESQGFRGDVLTNEEVMYILERRSAATSSDRLIGRVVNHILAWEPPAGVEPDAVRISMPPENLWPAISAGFLCGGRTYRVTRLLYDLDVESLSPDHAGHIMTAQMTRAAQEARREQRPRATTFDHAYRRWTPKPGEPEGPGG